MRSVSCFKGVSETIHLKPFFKHWLNKYPPNHTVDIKPFIKKKPFSFYLRGPCIPIYISQYVHIEIHKESTNSFKFKGHYQN